METSGWSGGPSHIEFLHGATNVLNFRHCGWYVHCRSARNQLPDHMNTGGRPGSCAASSIHSPQRPDSSTVRQVQPCHSHLELSLLLHRSPTFLAFWEALLGSWEHCSEPGCNYHKTASHFRKKKLKEMKAGLWAVQEMIANWSWTQNCN